jgi:hypothetical protein
MGFVGKTEMELPTFDPTRNSIDFLAISHKNSSILSLPQKI